MKERVEMMGNKFGKLTVLEMIGERVAGRHPSWKCVCDCGKECVRTATALRAGKKSSCGCAIKSFQREKHNLSGKKFDRLLVLQAKNTSSLKRHILWKCVCDCGQETTATGSDLRSGHKKSCGCLQREITSENSTKHGHAKPKQQTRTYVSWASMHTRCKNKNAMNFKHYGGRGISVCERWESFENFLIDMGERPSGKSLDRIDVDGNYELSNCKWSTASEQVKNQRRYKNVQ